MSETEEKIEALAKIERQILWLRDDIKALNKKTASAIEPFIYFIGVAVMLGMTMTADGSFWHKTLAALLWPISLGMLIAEKIK